MNESLQGPINPLRKDGVWRQERHTPNTINEDGLQDYEPFEIKRESGSWVVAQGNGERGWVSVREDIARVIVIGIEAERRMKQRKVHWEIESSTPDTDEEGNEIYFFDGATYQAKLQSLALPKKYMEFYCHAVLQQLLKLPRGASDSDEVYRSIEGFTFTKADSFENLIGLLQGFDFPIIGRIAKEGVRTHEDLNMFSDVHSFVILGKDGGGEHLCFEKADSFENPVRLNTLRHIYEYHQGYRFAFQSFDSVAEQVEKRGLRQRAV